MGRLVAEAKVPNRAAIYTLHCPERALQPAMLVVVHGPKLLGAAVAALDHTHRAQLSKVDGFFPGSEVVDTTAQTALNYPLGTLRCAVLIMIACAEVQNTTSEPALDLPQWTFPTDVLLEGAIENGMAALPAAPCACLWALRWAVIGNLGRIQHTSAAPEWACHVEDRAHGEVRLEISPAERDDTALERAAPDEPHRTIDFAVMLHIFDLDAGPTALDASLAPQRALLVEVSVEIHSNESLDPAPIRAFHRTQWAYSGVIGSILGLEVNDTARLGAQTVGILLPGVNHRANDHPLWAM